MVPSQAAPPPEQSMLVASFDSWASRILLALVGLGGLATLFWRRRRPVAVPARVESEQA